MAPVLFPSKPREASPHHKLSDAWLADYELAHRHMWNHRKESRGDPAVRQFFEAVRDQLRAQGALATVDPVIGAVYIIDALREQPGFVVWSVSADSGAWSGHLADAREINLQGTGVRPGMGAALASLGPPPSGLFNTLALGGDYRKRQSVVASVYGPGGTGVELLDYPDKMFDFFDVDLDVFDPYDPAALAGAMMAAMRAKGISFTGVSAISNPERAGQDCAQTPVKVTSELASRWCVLGAAGGSWRAKRYGGTAFHMPVPA